ncbi:MAG: phosphotransferase [Erysipelothrix sp.]|jgi:thiamine kinase-like enzyme|nr:phosphotransferase [Erysipelothrix sp.]
MELKNLKHIGQGKIASVLSDGIFAYKVFPSWYPSECIEDEVKVYNEIEKHTSLHIAKCELLKENHAIKMTLVKGETIAHKMKKEKFPLGIETLIQCQSQIFQYQGLNLEDAFSSFESKISSSSLEYNIKVKALKSLHSIEKSKRLCHFDLHLENIMMSEENIIIIDWVNAKLGNPVMDIARTYVILLQYVKRKANLYLKEICKALDYDTHDVMKAVPLMAALRLLENDANSFHETLKQLILFEQ